MNHCDVLSFDTNPYNNEIVNNNQQGDNNLEITSIAIDTDYSDDESLYSNDSLLSE